MTEFFTKSATGISTLLKQTTENFLCLNVSLNLFNMYQNATLMQINQLLQANAN